MNEETTSPIDSFLQWVGELARNDDRGTLAELRRGLSETTQEQAWGHIVRFSRKDFENDLSRAVWCSVGGLAALMIPKGFVTEEKKDNLGTTMRKVALKAVAGENVSFADKEKTLKNFSPRLRRVLDETDTISLCEMVVQIVRMAFNKEVPVNLRNLFLSLRSWNDSEQREKTRLKWTQQYYTLFEPRPDSPWDQGGQAE